MMDRPIDLRARLSLLLVILLSTIQIGLELIHSQLFIYCTNTPTCILIFWTRKEPITTHFFILPSQKHVSFFLPKTEF